MESKQTSDPKVHVANVKGKLDEIAQHLEEDLDKIDDIPTRALFETTREVLSGLIKAFEHHQQGSESWSDGEDVRH